MNDRDWMKAVELAEHYKALGQADDIYLYGQLDCPWGYVTGFSAGGSHRLEIATGVSFVAKHPSGLTFRWNFELEPHSADGSGSYHIDMDGILGVLDKLPPAMAVSFKAYLRALSEPVLKRAKEWADSAERQQRVGDTLFALGAGLPAYRESEEA